MEKLILLAISLIALFAQDSAQSLTLTYYHTDAKAYSIIKEEDKFKIRIEEVVNCFVEPCIFPILDEKPIVDEEDCEKLQQLFLDIFEGSDVNLKTVNDLEPEQLEIIFEVFENNNVFSELKYEIVNQNEYYLSQYRERGYTYQKLNDTYICIIAMGERRTGGYSISIKKVKIKGNSVTIYVTEKSPGPFDIVTQAFTYPKVTIKFNKKPEQTEVVDYETGEKFDQIGLIQ